MAKPFANSGDLDQMPTKLLFFLGFCCTPAFVFVCLVVCPDTCWSTLIFLKTTIDVLENSRIYLNFSFTDLTFNTDVDWTDMIVLL